MLSFDEISMILDQTWVKENTSLVEGDNRCKCHLLEAIFLVNIIPNSLSRESCISCKSLRISQKVDILHPRRWLIYNTITMNTLRFQCIIKKIFLHVNNNTGYQFLAILQYKRQWSQVKLMPVAIDQRTKGWKKKKKKKKEKILILYQNYWEKPNKR